MHYQSLTDPNDTVVADEETEAFVGDGETTDAEIEEQYNAYLYQADAMLNSPHIRF